MDAFENVIATILQRRGFWTLINVKVDLSPAEKRAIKRESSPRWELDIVAYSGKSNQVLVVECKSYLDSPGVDSRAFDGSSPKKAKRYKLFCDHTLRRIVLRNLKRHLVSKGFCGRNPRITLCLAAGRIRGDEGWLKSHFKQNGWKLIGPQEIHDELKQLGEEGYENSIAAVVTKILLRPAKRSRTKPGVDAAK